MDDLDSLKSILEEKFTGYECRLFKCETQEKRKKLLESKMPDPNCQPDIPKENAWICWILDELGYIIDLQVYELDASMMFRWEKTVAYVDRKCKERGIIYRDFGRVNSDWNEWRLSDVLFKFGCQYGFNDRNKMVRCMRNLATIKEFKDDILGWLKFLENP